ncbi:Hypothetical protein A7982_10558 [Minicystis rosea]|nr:Hypothetical protein A7982_10558 [Minicystis rosea]
MSLEVLRSLARLHALAAWIATAALIAAAVVHVHDKSRRLSAWLAAAAATLSLLAGGLGMALHDGYRARIRQRLFLASASLGWLFERKQHLAFGAVLLAVAGAALTAVTQRVESRPGSDDLARELRRGARVAWTASALLALTASIASAWVAKRMTF